MGFFDWLIKKEKPHVEEVCVKRDSDFSSFKDVTDYIYTKSGIIDLDKRALTASRLQQYAISQDIYSTREFLSRMNHDPQFYQNMINIATVNETFFMRELKELEWLVSYIKESNHTLKILCIPSSSGEEVYSILLLMLQHGLSLSKVKLIAYDINSDAVDDAIKGEYDEHSLHKIDKTLRARYFDKGLDSKYRITTEVKKSVRFEQNNIFDLDTSKESYDVILSRNMFIYFDDKKRELALQIIIDMLKPNGLYIKGHADHIKKHSKLEKIAYGIYKKNDLF